MQNVKNYLNACFRRRIQNCVETREIIGARLLLYQAPTGSLAHRSYPKWQQGFKISFGVQIMAS